MLVLDIETQRAIVECWSLFKPWIPIDCVQVPTRVLCFAAKWRDSGKMIFESAWDEDENYNVDEGQYRTMLQAAYNLLDEADVVVTWNGDRFDNQWVEAELGRLKIGRPAPYKSVDLIKTNKKFFRGGQMSMKLDWSSRMWLRDKKLPHGGTDLWWDIRHGTPKERAAAIETMQEYNEKDVTLTGQLFEEYLPYVPVNLAMYQTPIDGELFRCCKCGGLNVHRRGSKNFVTLGGTYQLWRCSDCNATSKGSRRYQMSTELRPV